MEKKFIKIPGGKFLGLSGAWKMKRRITRQAKINVIMLEYFSGSDRIDKEQLSGGVTAISTELRWAEINLWP